MCEPQQRDVILRGSDSARLGWWKHGRDQFRWCFPIVSVMPGDRKEQMGVDRRLTVFGGDDDHRRPEQSSLLQFLNHLADRAIDELDLASHRGGGGAGRIRISALNFWP